MEAKLRACAAHRSAGNLRAALRAASDACHAAPNRPEPHYAYGEIWLALGEFARAEQAFAAAIQLAPASAEPWVNYGIARYKQDALEDAKTAMREALKRDPGHKVATANLAAFMRISGEGEQAEPLLRQALAQEPDNMGARLNLAVELLDQERCAEALALLDESTPTTPDALRHWRLQRSLALLRLRRLNEAGAELAMLDDMPPELRPLLLWRKLLLAIARGEPAAPLASAMAQACEEMGPHAVPEHRLMAHYDLASFFARNGDTAKAMAQWRRGHALLARLQPFSRPAYQDFIAANIEAFSAARFTTGSRAQNTDACPVFIVGMPRSGTTLCEQILAAHADAHGAGERMALSLAFHRLGGPHAATLDAAALDEAATAYLAELHALAPEAKRIIDKMPGNTLYLGLAALMFPGAKIIHCVRDPRDIGLSIFTYRFYGTHPYAHDLADLGWTIAQQERLMAHWRAVLPNPILTVKLSDWVEDFDATLARVLAHLGLPSDENCKRFHESTAPVRTVSRAQVRRPVNAAGLGRWCAYAAELTPLIAELETAGLLEAWSKDTK